jgi:hypothetical protein
MIGVIFVDQFVEKSNCSPVIPAKTGIHPDCDECKLTRWIPAFAGMTGEQLLKNASSTRHGAGALCHIIQEGNRIDKIRDAMRHSFALGWYELGARVLFRYTGSHDGASNG